jgi:hypothetical protein
MSDKALFYTKFTVNKTDLESFVQTYLEKNTELGAEGRIEAAQMFFITKITAMEIKIEMLLQQIQQLQPKPKGG